MQTGDTFALQFYDNSIFPGTKIWVCPVVKIPLFYDNSIFPGTKIGVFPNPSTNLFYDNSIFPGTKICKQEIHLRSSFTITQFFQVLKYQIAIYTNYYNIFIPHL